MPLTLKVLNARRYRDAFLFGVYGKLHFDFVMTVGANGWIDDCVSQTWVWCMGGGEL